PAPIQQAQQAVAANQVKSIPDWFLWWAGQSADNAADVIPYATLEERRELQAVAGLPCHRSCSDGVTLTESAEALRAAFLLTGDELSEIIAALEFTDQTMLTLDDISAIFRRGWLARKLKLSVREFLLLMKVTRVDPFAPPDLADPPTDPVHPSILRFIDVVSRLRAASLKPEQALYLIWNQDISGKSAPEGGEILEFARTLRAAFSAIESEFALSDDPNGQIARARMALVYGNDATNFFFGLLDNTLVSEVPYDHDQATLEQPILDAPPPGRIGYDDFGKRLSYTGVMTKDARDALQAASTSAEFKDAVHSPDPDKRSLYEENQKVIGPFFDRYPELLPLYDAYVASNETVEKKRSDLLASFLPELKHRRKRQQALAAVSAAAKADIPFASALLDDKMVLNPAAAPASPNLDDLPPALDDLTAMETAGLSARLYAGTTVGGPGVQPDHASDAEANLAYSTNGGATLPFSPASGIWSGYLEAPENGLYKFSIEPGVAGGAGPATATLTLNGEDKPLEKNGEVWSNTTAIELRAGTLYPITLIVEDITAGLKVRWETKGRGWEVIPPGYLYPATLTGHLRTTYVRFLKAASLAAGLKLTASEMAYFAAKEDYRIGDRGWLNSLPVAGSPDAVTSTALLKAFEALLDFAGLKAKLAPNDERLLTVLKDPDATIETTDEIPEEDKESLLLALTRWDGASLDALLLRFGKHLSEQPDQADRAALKDLGIFLRVYRANAPVKKIGVSASALIAATTNEPQAPAVRAFKAALRARYEESDWLNVLRPINDEMRSLQRDALVAYILHQMRADPVSEHIDTPEKLFEYFLTDVQMDPCMQTSRIRHALSSIQLFIERCLMNLETGVAPSVFKAKQRKQWEWMKRYRVWEANRKVFLWPENWVEPELRGDQSPFFKEAMSELLQSDITEDRAATALLNYLSKLEEVAKLEPCGIHFVEGDTGTADDIAHVVARTAGANRKYFYRRYEYGLWTPWEQIKLDIEDNPVIPVVWKDRLFLFWLKILKEALPSEQDLGAGDGETELKDIKVKNINTEPPKVKVQAMLCWSEYYNGKWQPTKTSDVNRPTELGRFDAAGPSPFDRSELLLSVREPDELEKDLPESGGLRVSIGDWSSFLLYNTHSAPVREEEAASAPPALSAQYRYLFTPSNTLFYVKYSTYDGNVSSDLTRDVLKNTIRDWTIEPRHELQNPWEAPFFYEDRRHVFYVTTKQILVPVQESLSYYGVSDSACMG
ncbi:MAG: neuraminidase-like domain-containing protein, partial [Gammaproteobacteria bacterium]